MADEQASAEIEITPEMIQAGEIALEWYRDSYHDGALVMAVYTAMRLLEGSAHGAKMATTTPGDVHFDKATSRD